MLVKKTHIYLLSGLLLTGAVSAWGQQPASSTFQVGSKTFSIEKRTSKGTPVVSMWKVQAAKDGPPYPLLKKAEHQLVWSPSKVEEGGYNHYACLIKYKGKFFAMWANHPFGEDGPGQRVLYSVSEKWGKWSQPRELFAPPGPIKPRKEKGIHLKPDRWIVVDGALYAVVYVHGAGRYPIARRLEADGKTGEPFVLEKLSAKAELPVYMKDATSPAVASKLVDWYRQHDKISWWAGEEQGVQRKAVDGSTLIETFMYRAKDDTLVLMARNWGTPSNPVHNNRVYVSFSKTYGDWSAPYPTDIPDSPTRGDALRLDDGTILLIGTHYAPKLDDALYLDRDPLTVSVSRDGFTFDKTFTLRAGAPKTWHIPHVGGINPGFAYTSSVIDDGFLYTLYSVGKEDMAISRVPLNEILK